MKKLFGILLSVSIIGIAGAEVVNSHSDQGSVIVIKQDCKYYAEGVKANLKDKNMKNVTMTYSQNYSTFAQICHNEINKLVPNLKIEPRLVHIDTMPTISYTENKI